MHQDESVNGVLTSIQVGAPKTHSDDEGEWTTAIFKDPIAGSVVAGELGMEGDGVADLEHHGGIDKAVLAYSADHYPRWNSELNVEFPYGAFGENLSFEHLSEANVCIGDRWKIGEALFEVAQPRKPCWKLSRRWANNSLPKLVVQTGRSGWYLRVVKTGAVTSGDEVNARVSPTTDLVNRSRERGSVWNQLRCETRVGSSAGTCGSVEAGISGMNGFSAVGHLIGC